MLGCIGLKCAPESAVAATTAGEERPKATGNADSHDNGGANDNELGAKPPSSTRPTASQRRGRCPFKQCLEGTFVRPTAITEQRPTVRSTKTEHTPRTDSQGRSDLERNAEILQQLGILHLHDKLTRPRQSQETEEHILREAGAALHLHDPDDLSDNEGVPDIVERIHKNRRKSERMTQRVVQILRDAGVTMLDSPIAKCPTEITVGVTVETSESYVTPEHHASDNHGVNNTYAEKELLRRLKHGWVSNGMDCPECGMPIISKKEGGEGLMECVICGVVESNEYEGHGENVQECFSCFDSTITSGFTMANHGQVVTKQHCVSCQTETISANPTIFSLDHQMYCSSCEKSMIQKCKSDLASQDDDTYKKELGKRIFSGWTLLSLNCPSCNLPLISEGKGSPHVCLRCG